MKKSSRSTRRSTTSRRPSSRSSGHMARRGVAVLRSWTTGALPIVEDFLQRMKLEALLEEFLPGDDRRTKIPTARAVVILVKQILLSRTPLYAVGEWIAGHDPAGLGLKPEQGSEDSMLQATDGKNTGGASATQPRFRALASRRWPKPQPRIRGQWPVAPLPGRVSCSRLGEPLALLRLTIPCSSMQLLFLPELSPYHGFAANNRRRTAALGATPTPVPNGI